MEFLPQTCHRVESISLTGILAFLLVCVAIPRQGFAQRPVSAVTVRVADERENGIAMADVRLYRFGHGDYSHRAFTGGDGSVEFPSVGEGDYILEVHANGYQPYRDRIDVMPGMSQSFSVALKAEAGAGGSSPAKRGGAISAEALAVPKSARKEFEEGLKQLRADAPAKGAHHFENAIKQYPHYVEAHAWLGMAYLEEKRHDEGLAEIQKAIALDPKLSLPHTMLGKLYAQDRDFSRAEAELLKSLELDPQAWDASFELSRCYFNMGKLDEALKYARQANGSPQALPITHLLLVDIYLRQRDSKGALAELKAFAKLAPESPLMPRVQAKIEQLAKSK